MKAHDLAKKRNSADSFSAALKSFRSQTTPTLPSSAKTSSPPSPTALIDEAVAKAIADPRFTGWSVPAKGVLLYLSATTPQFRASHLINEYIAAGLAADYPDLWSTITNHIQTPSTRSRSDSNTPTHDH